MLPFLLIGITSIACSFLYFYQKFPQQFQEMLFSEWWTPIAFGCGVFSMVYFAFFVIFHAFGHTSFSINSQFLILKKKIFCFSISKTISIKEIRFLEQIKDGGEGEDSFPSWGLRLIANKKYWLLSRQSIDKSDWLGNFLAKKLGVDYNKDSKIKSNV